MLLVVCVLVCCCLCAIVFIYCVMCYGLLVVPRLHERVDDDGEEEVEEREEDDEHEGSLTAERSRHPQSPTGAPDSQFRRM